jgi:hypothetical protein
VHDGNIFISNLNKQFCIHILFFFFVFTQCLIRVEIDYDSVWTEMSSEGYADTHCQLSAKSLDFTGFDW